MEISIGTHTIGENNPAFIVAEVGSNHNHDLEKAKAIIKAARDAGADAVKFQTFKAESHYSKYSPTFEYLQTDTYDLIESLELDRRWHKKLQEHCTELDTVFFSSACDKEAIDDLEKLDVALYKVASFDMVDYDLIDYLAKTGKPIIVSTGMAALEEIELVENVMKENGNDQLILLECTSLYPTPLRLTDLRRIETLSENFECVAGLSDHTQTVHLPMAAVAVGARVIEKHLTLDKNDKGPDHAFALEPHEFKTMVQYIRDFESAYGDGIKNGPREEEKDMWEKGRRSLHVNKDLKAGHILEREDVICKRPGLGIHPKEREHIVGKTLKRDIKEDMWITEHDIE